MPNGSIGQAILRSDKYFTDGQITLLQNAREYSLEAREFQAWEMPDNPMDRSDPSDKQSYGRTNILPMVK